MSPTGTHTLREQVHQLRPWEDVCMYINIHTYKHINTYIYTTVQKFGVTWKCLYFSKKSTVFSIKITLNQSEIHSLHC